MRKCFVHIGRHKTGTSAIQWTLHHHREELKHRGYLYPESGVPPTSVTHYNIAWEIAGLSLYDRKFGNIDDLIEEISGSSHDVVISSEDFSIAIRSLPDFRSFIKRLSSCGLAVAIVCYFRNPHDYLRSAFFELLKTDFPFGFSRLVTAIADDETLTWKSHSAVGRDTLVENLASLSQDDGVTVIARSYDDVSKAVVADFFSIIGLKLSDFANDDEPRRNEIDTTGNAFGRFFGNVTGLAPNDRESALIASLGSAVPMRSLYMGEPARRLISRKYEPELHVLAMRFGVSLSEMARDPEIGWVPTLEEVFSETMVHFVQLAARLDAEAYGSTDADRRSLVHPLDDLRLERDHLVSARDDLIAQRNELTRRYEHVAAERDGLAHLRDDWLVERESLTHSRDDLATERDMLASTRDDIAAERDTLRRMYEQVRASRDALLTSRSWRLTAPLRTVSTWIAKGGHDSR